MRADWCQGSLTTAINWCLIECAVGIISCSLPPLRPLFVLVFGRSDTTHDNSGPSAVITVGTRPLRPIANGNDVQRPSYEDITINPVECTKSNHRSADLVPLTGIDVRTKIERPEKSLVAALSPAPSAVTVTAAHSD